MRRSKPLRRRDRNVPCAQIAGEAKAIQVKGRADLEAIWPRLAAPGTELVARVLVPGPETQIETYHVYRDITGQIAGEFTGREVRTFPRRFRHSTAVETTDASDVRTLGRELVERLDLLGVAKFDMPFPFVAALGPAGRDQGRGRDRRPFAVSSRHRVAPTDRHTAQAARQSAS